MKLLCVVQNYDNSRMGIIAKQGETVEAGEELATALLESGAWIPVDETPKANTASKTTKGKKRRPRKKVSIEEAMDPENTTSGHVK